LVYPQTDNTQYFGRMESNKKAIRGKINMPINPKTSRGGAKKAGRKKP